MFTSFIDKLITVKGIKYVYTHNLSGFDGFYLIKHLLYHKSHIEISPLIQDGKIKCIKFKYKNPKDKVCTIVFKDSHLLLPLTLIKLTEAFGFGLKKFFLPVISLVSWL